MANDLATGLGLGLRAAEMQGRWSEAEKDRALREAMAQRQRDFTAEQAGLDRTHGTSERKAGEEFKKGESKLERKSKKKSGERAIKAAADAAGIKQKFDEKWKKTFLSAQQMRDSMGNILGQAKLGLSRKLFELSERRQEHLEKPQKMKDLEGLDALIKHKETEIKGERDQNNHKLRTIEALTHELRTGRAANGPWWPKGKEIEAQIHMLNANWKEVNDGINEKERKWKERADRAEREIGSPSQTTHTFTPGTKPVADPNDPTGSKTISVPDPSAPMNETIRTNDPEEVERLRNLNQDPLRLGIGP